MCVCSTLEGDQCHGKNLGRVHEIRNTCMGRGGWWASEQLALEAIILAAHSSWALGIGDGQGSLASCGSWGRRVRCDWATELNWTEELLKKVGKLATWKSGASPTSCGMPSTVLPRESHPACPGPHGDGWLQEKPSKAEVCLSVLPKICSQLAVITWAVGHLLL